MDHVKLMGVALPPALKGVLHKIILFYSFLNLIWQVDEVCFRTFQTESGLDGHKNTCMIIYVCFFFEDPLIKLCMHLMGHRDTPQINWFPLIYNWLIFYLFLNCSQGLTCIMPIMECKEKQDYSDPFGFQFLMEWANPLHTTLIEASYSLIGGTRAPTNNPLAYPPYPFNGSMSPRYICLDH